MSTRCSLMLVAMLSWPGLAAAQADDPAAAGGAEEAPDGADERNRATARAFFQEGLAFADRGEFERAVDRFRRTYALQPTSGVAYNLASALIEIGRLVEASELLRGVLRDAGASNLHPTAQQKLDAILPRLGRLTVNVEGPTEGIEVTLAGRSIPIEALGAPMPADPGDQPVVVTRGESVVASSEVTLDEGGEAEITLDVPPPVAMPEETAAAVPRSMSLGPDDGYVDRNADDDGSVLASWWFWTGIVVIAGAAVATVLLTSAEDEQPIPGTTEPAVLSW